MTIGKKGSTVVFSIPNLELNGNVLSWDSFKFYTPVGDQDDGYKYFNVDEDEILIERDPIFFREVFVYAINGTVTAQGFFEEENISLPAFGLNSDVLFVVKIPPEGAGDIEIEQREVTDG